MTQPGPRSWSPVAKSATQDAKSIAKRMCGIFVVAHRVLTNTHLRLTV